MIKMFADDTRVFRRICSPEDSRQLQEDLDELGRWSDKWLLKFNKDKCKRMHIGRKNVKHQYTMGEGAEQQVLEETKEERDLGVMMPNDLKPTLQSNTAARKGMNVLRSIKRSFSYINRESFKILYKTYIRPHLEYCVQAWCPYNRKDIKCLEKVQRRATKLVWRIKDWDYEDRLKYLDIYSLERRRTRGDLIETYKIMHNIDKTPEETYFQRSESTQLRGHSLKLHKKPVNTKMRQMFFSQRVVNAWNVLPEEVVQASSINAFKSRLDKFWKIERHEPTISQQSL